MTARVEYEVRIRGDAPPEHRAAILRFAAAQLGAPADGLRDREPIPAERTSAADSAPALEKLR